MSEHGAASPSWAPTPHVGRGKQKWWGKQKTKDTELEDFETTENLSDCPEKREVEIKRGPRLKEMSLRGFAVKVGCNGCARSGRCPAQLCVLRLATETNSAAPHLT